MAYALYVVRVVAKAIIAKSDMGLGAPEELVLAYPEAERQAILAEVYRIRPDLVQKRVTSGPGAEVSHGYRSRATVSGP